MLYYCMVNTKQAIGIIGCNRRTLTKYIQDGLIIVKEVLKGANQFEEESVRSLIQIYEDQKSSIPKKFVPEETEPKNKPSNNVEKYLELNEIGMAIFKQAVEELKDLGIYRSSDDIAISSYSMQYQLYEHYQELSYIDGGIVYSKTGTKPSPYAMLADRHFSNYQKIQMNLGLNPSARQKLTIKEKKDIDDMTELFG
jgi:P27 family predicted phage terminase small subunit